jgi:hypothetical protein
MRILVISDLHANWPALEAVLGAQAFDRVIVVGDLVSYGPHPREVVGWVRSHATVAVRGNHDDALACGSDCRCAPTSKPLAIATRAVHRELPSLGDIQFLGSLPRTASLQSSGPTSFDATDGGWPILGAPHLRAGDGQHRSEHCAAVAVLGAAREVTGMYSRSSLRGRAHDVFDLQP